MRRDAEITIEGTLCCTICSRCLCSRTFAAPIVDVAPHTARDMIAPGKDLGHSEGKKRTKKTETKEKASDCKKGCCDGDAAGGSKCAVSAVAPAVAVAGAASVPLPPVNAEMEVEEAD